MNYIKIKIYIPNNDKVDLLYSVLDDNKITGIIIEDPEIYEEFFNKKNAYDWDYVDKGLIKLAEVQKSVTFYLDDSPEGVEKLDHVLGEIKGLGLDYAEIANVCDEDWKDKWKKYFKPSKITDRIVIKPSWENYHSTDSDEIIIELDPGMAFGTGTHETTSMCLKLLEKYLVNRNKTVMDVGCGSGILSIGAALLGAEKVLGIDIDPIAVNIAKDNVRINNLDSRISILKGNLMDGIDIKADIIVSNLMADLIILMSKSVSSYMNKNGIYISSGILLQKKDEVCCAIHSAGLNIIEIMEDGLWCAIVAVV